MICMLKVAESGGLRCYGKHKRRGKVLQSKKAEKRPSWLIYYDARASLTWPFVPAKKD